MDTPAPSPAHPASGWPRPVLLLVAVLVAGYGVFLFRHISPHAGGSDSSGYFNSARLFSRGEFQTRPRILSGHTATEFGRMAYQPLGFIMHEDNRMAPTYPTGLPLLMLVAVGLTGWAHPVEAVNLFTALACGGLFYALARRLGLGVALAFAGLVLMWLCPLFLFVAFQPLSDLPALGCALAVLYSALRITEGRGWALACGAVISLAVLLRPTNVLLVLPVLVAAGWRPRDLLLVAVGGLPGALFFGYYNWRVYGGPLTTGYGEVWTEFSPEFLAHNLAHFAYWIPVLLSPVVVLALAAPFLRSLRRRDTLSLALWFVLLAGLYSFYFHSGEKWWYLRFILPAFPVPILASLFVLQALWSRPRPAWLSAALIGLLLALTGWWQIRQTRQLDLLDTEAGERTYPDAARWAQQNLPGNSAVFSLQVSGAFYYYTDFLLLRWDQFLFEKRDALLAALADEQRPVYAALFPFETPQALERIGGQWTKLATVGQVTFWRRQP